MSFQITLDINIGSDTETDFFDEIVLQNEGEAIQALASGKAIDFGKVTAQQKKDFVLTKLAEQFANIYANSKIEREVNAFRKQKQEERKAQNG